MYTYIFMIPHDAASGQKPGFVGQAHIIDFDFFDCESQTNTNDTNIYFRRTF